MGGALMQPPRAICMINIGFSLKERGEGTNTSLVLMASAVDPNRERQSALDSIPDFDDAKMPALP